MLQLVLGIAYWMLPRFWHGPPRGSETGARIAFVLLNLGLWFVALGVALTAPATVLFLGRLLELAAVAAFAIHIWPRVVPRN